MAKKPNEDKKAQHARFVEAAKAAGCDDDEEKFAAAVKKVAKAPPPHQPAKRSK